MLHSNLTESIQFGNNFTLFHHHFYVKTADYEKGFYPCYFPLLVKSTEVKSMLRNSSNKHYSSWRPENSYFASDILKDRSL